MAYNGGKYPTQYQQPNSEYDMSNPHPPPIPPPHRAPSSSFEDYPQANDSSLNLGPTQADDSEYAKSMSFNKSNPRSQKRPSSISEQKLIGSYDSDEEETMSHKEKSLKKKKKKRSCFHYLCCICCPCLPIWLRWICCGCFLIILAMAAAVGVLAAMFKYPTVNFKGASQTPKFVPNGTSWTISTELGIEVINPNVEHVTFSSVKAIAYYPTTKNIVPRPSIGGGELANVHINSQATTNISFPFHIDYNPDEDADQAILMDIANKCGLLGAPKVPLTVEYDLTLSIKLIMITISPTVHQKATFDCPIQNGQLPLPAGVTGLGSTTAASTSPTPSV